MTRTDAAEQLRSLVEAGEREAGSALAQLPGGDRLAAEVGGELAFRWRLVALRALLQDPPDDDSVAERYGELLEDARQDPARLQLARPLGEALRALQAVGKVPRVMLARTRRHRTGE